MNGTAILKAPTKRAERKDKDAEKHDGDHHRDHTGNIVAGPPNHEPCSGQRQNEGDQIDVARCIWNGFHEFTI